MNKDQARFLRVLQRLHRVTLGIGFLSVILPIIFWKRIPKKVPMHYGANGVCDRMGDRSELILLFFVVLLLMGFMSIAIYFIKTNATSKYAKEEEKSGLTTVYPMLVVMNFFLMCGFAYMILCSVMVRNLGSMFLPVFVGSTFAPLVYFLRKEQKFRKTYHESMKDFQYMEQFEQGEIYKAHVDWWLGILLLVPLLFEIVSFVKTWMSEGKVNWLMLALIGLVSGIVYPLFFIRYILYSKHLLVSMPIYGKVRIPYNGIKNMKETHNPISSAAPSLDRIQIDYVIQGRHDMILISPSRKKLFLEKVEEKRKEVLE